MKKGGQRPVRFTPDPRRKQRFSCSPMMVFVAVAVVAVLAVVLLRRPRVPLEAAPIGKKGEGSCAARLRYALWRGSRVVKVRQPRLTT